LSTLFTASKNVQTLIFELKHLDLAGSKQISVHYGLVLNPQFREEDEYSNLTPAQKDAFETDILAMDNAYKESWNHITKICVNELQGYFKLEFFRRNIPQLGEYETKFILPINTIEEVRSKMQSVFVMDLFKCTQVGHRVFSWQGEASRGELGAYKRVRENTVERGERRSRR